MKKFMATVTAGLMVCAVALLGTGQTAQAATAGDVVTADKLIVASNTAYAVTLSKSETSKPLEVKVFKATPTNSTLVMFSIHTDALGVAKTTTCSSVQIPEGGNLSTNMANLFTGYLFKAEPLYIKLGQASNTAVQVIGELYGGN